MNRVKKKKKKKKKKKIVGSIPTLSTNSLVGKKAKGRALGLKIPDL